MKIIAKNSLSVRIEHRSSLSYDKKEKGREELHLHEVWTKQYEYELIDMYERTNNFEAITSYFIKRFSLHSAYFSVSSLRRRLFKIIRLAIRKMHEDIALSDGSCGYELLKLKNVHVRMMVQYPDAHRIRMMLLNYYKMDVGR